jgi:hypothetical protein
VVAIRDDEFDRIGEPAEQRMPGREPAPQVAEWAGHRVHVLLKVYAKCIDGQEDVAKRRIENALAAKEEDEPEG